MLCLKNIDRIIKQRICACGEQLTAEKFCPIHGPTVLADHYLVKANFHYCDKTKASIDHLEPISVILPHSQFLKLFRRGKGIFSYHVQRLVVYDVHIKTKTSDSIGETIQNYINYIDEFYEILGKICISSTAIKRSGVILHYLCEYKICTERKARFYFSFTFVRRLSNYIKWRLQQANAKKEHIINSLRNTRKDVILSKNGTQETISSIVWDPKKKLPSQIVTSNGKRLASQLFQSQDHFLVGSRIEDQAVSNLDKVVYRFLTGLSRFIQWRYKKCQADVLSFWKNKADRLLFKAYKGKKVNLNTRFLQKIGLKLNQQIRENFNPLSKLFSSNNSSISVVLACSATKVEDDPNTEDIAAFLRYSGSSYLIIKNYLLKHRNNLNLIIVSAKYGLLHPCEKISMYNSRLTEKNLEKKQELIKRQIKQKKFNLSTDRVFFNMPLIYLKACKSLIDTFKSNNCVVIEAEGPLDDRNIAMVQYLKNNQSFD